MLSAVRAGVSPWDAAERKEEIYPDHNTFIHS